jgi:hypothetical protein
MQVYPAKTVIMPSRIVERGGNVPRHNKAAAIGVARSISKCGVLDKAR